MSGFMTHIPMVNTKKKVPIKSAMYLRIIKNMIYPRL